MHIIWFLAWLFIVVAHAQALALDKRVPLRFMRKGRPFTNITAPGLFLNATTIATSSSILTDTSVSPTWVPPYTSPPSSSSTEYTHSTTEVPTCTGSVTYYGSVPPTVYMTVTEGFTVTVTASNVSVTETPTLVTPLPACQATIMPLLGTFDSNITTSSVAAKSGYSTSTGGIPALVTSDPDAPAAGPPAPAPPPAPLGSLSPEASAVYSSVHYTSTVIVTKKTPVTVVSPQTSPADVNFQYPSTDVPEHPSTIAGNTDPDPPANGGKGTSGGNGSNNDDDDNSNPGYNSNHNGSPNDNEDNNNNGGGGGDGGATDNGQGDNNDGDGGNGNGGGDSNNVGGSDRGHSNPSPSGKSNDNGDAQPGHVGSSPAASNHVMSSASVDGHGTGAGATRAPGEAPATTTKVGNIIASIINSPFATASATGGPLTNYFTTRVHGIPIVLCPSSVIIGSETVAIPTSAPTTVDANGIAFTIRSSEVVAPGTTVTIPPLYQNHGPTTAAPASTIVTAVGQITFTIGPTVAIFSDTTYRIGQGAPATTIAVNGTQVILGPEGVGLPGTTLNASDITRVSFTEYTVEGLTFSVDSSEAVLSGITYRIASEASQLTTTIGSQTVSFGPGGVGLKSTTIVPPNAASPSAQSGLKATSVAASATQSAVTSNAASLKMENPSSALLGCVLAAVPLGWIIL